MKPTMNSRQPHYVFAIHVGHTRTKLGLYEVSKTPSLPASRWGTSCANEDPFPWQEVGSKTDVAQGSMTFIVTGSNRPRIKHLLDNWSLDRSPPLTIPDNSRIPISIDVEYPDRVGPDRILNGVAVNRLRPADRPAIIVDSGTATTVDVIARQGSFQGGAILPGIVMGARALHEFTTTLPLIDGREFLVQSPEALGKRTETAMASGLYWGHVGAVKELVHRLSSTVDAVPDLFLTGGAASILAPSFPNARLVSDLTLIGTVITAIELWNSPEQTDSI